MAQVTQEFDYGYPSKRSRSQSYGRPERSAPRIKYRGASKKYSKKVPASLRSYVKSSISRSLEVKKASGIANQVQFNPQILVGDCILMTPGLAQGTGQGSRTGNSVTTKRCVVRMVVNSIYVATAGSPTYVDIYFFKNKKSNTISSTSDFLQLGSGSTDYNGDATPICGLLTVNEDVFRDCIHRRVEVFNPPNTTTTAYAASINPSVCLVFDVTRFMKKKLTFDDTNNVCTNDNLFMAIGTTQTDGSNVGAVNTVEVTYTVEYEYYDA